MAISGKTIKIIWGKAAARCAICKNELIKTSQNEISESLIGEICHIISKRINGPRYDPSISDLENLDMPDNLLLLCCNHHKIIDHHNEYSVEKLKKIKYDHEKYIKERLVYQRTEENIKKYVQRVFTGRELLERTNGTLACETYYDTPIHPSHIEVISKFIDLAVELSDDYDLLPLAYKMEVEAEITDLILELDELGYYCFADSVFKNIYENFRIDDIWKIMAIYVIRKDNKEIIIKEIKEN